MWNSALTVLRRSLGWSVVLGMMILTASFVTVEAAAQTVITGPSPYPDGGDPTNPVAVTACNGRAQIGLVYRNSETEPYIAVNPIDTDNMIATWHQDRWSNGGAQGIGVAYTKNGGASWTTINVPFSRCAGAESRSAGDYSRASDPWISFGPDGTARLMVLVADLPKNRNGQIAASSPDGGESWSDPVIIKRSEGKPAFGKSILNDKNTVTSDPFDSDLVYATWTLFRNRSFAVLFSRSTDGGQRWEASRPVNKNDNVAPAQRVTFRQGAQIVVLPDGTLLNVFFRELSDKMTGDDILEQAIFRSTDKGRHWEKMDTVVAEMFVGMAIDLELNIAVRDALELPGIAINDSNGDLYVVWQDTRFNAGLVGVVISRSTDGGDTWSAPVPVNTIANVQAFLPAVAVADDGTVGVLFYDFRNDQPSDATLDTDVHLKRFSPDLSALLDEQTLTSASFDMRQMVITGARGYFPGDYVGLDTVHNDFVAAYTIANNFGLPVGFPQDNTILQVDDANRQDIVFSRVTALP